MTKLRVTKIEKVNLQAENRDVLNVTFQIVDGDAVLEEKVQNFPLDITEESLQGELAKALEASNLERESKAANEAQDAAQANADTLIENLTGLEIGSGETAAEEEVTPEPTAEVSETTPVEPTQPAVEPEVAGDETAPEEEANAPTQ